MPERPKILVFIDWYRPGYKAGGPIRSVSAMAQLLGDEFDFYIITSDRDFGDDESFKGIEYGKWNTLSPSGEKVWYCRSGEKAEEVMRAIMRSETFSVLYFNSIFSRAFMLNPLRALRREKPDARIILAPRGMLGEGALKIKSLKKKVFFITAKIFGWFGNVTFHASSEQEEKEIRSVFGDRADVKVALNLSVPASATVETKSKKKNELHLFFLSRISPKKNLLAALQMLREVSSAYTIHFSVFGPEEDSVYAAECRKAASELPPHITCHFHGAVAASQIPLVLQNQQVLFLPTHHENFGHAIVDALFSGCPVIISQHTPWRNLSASQSGFDLALSDPKKMVEAIEFFAAMDEAEYLRWSEAARRFAGAQTNNQQATEANRKLFR